MKTHHYSVEVEWAGARQQGTTSYEAYGREHIIRGPGKPDLPGSSDPAFRGHADRYNPEELLVSALSACHMLWYLHLAAKAGVVVLAYTDAPDGTMVETTDGTGGHFTEMTLRPHVTVAQPEMAEKAQALHEAAHKLCYIANSVNFPVRFEPQVAVAAQP